MAYRPSSLQQDIALKRFTSAPLDQKPQFEWSKALEGSSETDIGTITLRSPQGETPYELSDVANKIGGALTDLLLSREETDVFTNENIEFVRKVTIQALNKIRQRRSGTSGGAVSYYELNRSIEETLIRNDAHDVAKSLIFNITSGANNQANGGAPLLTRLIRRNNQVVPWNASKIEIAVRKAFLSLQRDSSPAISVAGAVTERIRSAAPAFIHIEEVQDIVQEELMRAGHFKVAEAYILYRADRAAMRIQEEALHGISSTPVGVDSQSSMLLVALPTGESFFWDGSDLRERIRFSTIGLDLAMSELEIETELRRSLYNDISEVSLKTTIILNAKSLIEKDADFAKFAGRILCTYIYEETLGWDIVKDGLGELKKLHQDYFRRYVEYGIRIGRLSENLRKFDIERLAEALDPSADMEFDYLGIQTLYDRYLIIDKSAEAQKRIETPQIFWMRVAMGLFWHEESEREEKAIALYEMYKTRRFCSSTPTLFNSGTKHSQLSSCYLYWVDDSIEGIMQRGIAENAYLSKWAGGLGGSWTSVRGTGSYISGTNGESQGVIPFLKLHNDQLVAVNQGGKRRGSGCAYLEVWHNDILEFLELRKNTGDDRRRTHDMNTANWIPDLFMKRMEARENWTLFRSNEAPDLHETYGAKFEALYLQYEAKAERGEIKSEKIPAIELWKRMLQMLFETGHPWITFKDPCNVRSPQDHVGVIHSSNLCTEITLNTGPDETAVCNLGSVILENHLKSDGSLDLSKLRETVRIAVRALDNVIDINYYPTEPAKRSNMRHRPVGLGVMGLQNALYKKGLAFESEEAIEFNDEFMEAIAYYAYEASSDLAKERGVYSSYQGSKWDRGLLPPDTLDLLEQERGVSVETPRGSRMDWTELRTKISHQGMRNSNVLAIAPTATISNIMGSSPCIEPAYKNLFVKSNLSGDFIVLNAFLVRDLKKRGLWNQGTLDNLKYFDGEIQDIPEIPEDLKKIYTTAFGVDFNAIIKAAARRQKWIDQSQSLNLFLAKPDMKTLSHMYRAAWRTGLKTTYYLRTLGASNIEKATVSVKKNVKEAMTQDFTPEQAQVCRLDAMQNGGECEACQ
jgi:ribonucleoside-diphosphate reductase alpha chain